MGPEGLAYRRVMLKLSGAVLAGDRGYGIDQESLGRVADELAELHSLGAEVAVVLGGGNIFRGLAAAASGMDRVTGDYMGMLATLMNGLALQESLERRGCQTRLQTALDVREVGEPFIRRRALRHLEKGRIVIFAAGTGNPYFTTDTAAVLRAVEVGAEVILKGTNVDGIYTADPIEDPSAELIHQLTYMDALKNRYKVMDSTAFSLSMDNKIKMVVFRVTKPGNILKIVRGEAIGTLVKEDA